jgi:Flp pilus assembly protein TadG
MQNLHTHNMQQLGPSTNRHRRGTTAVEVAIVLPLLLLLLFAAIDYSRANSIRNTAENAAYEGARRAIVPGGTGQAAKDTANEILNILSIKNASVTVTPTTITNTTPQISVTVGVPLGVNLYAASPFLTATTITRTCTLTREQFTVATP